MSISGIRYRAEGALMVLQVLAYGTSDRYSSYNDVASWRDAGVGDLLDVAAHNAERMNELRARVETLEAMAHAPARNSC